MRLLHTKTLELREFRDADHAPPYAILSHRWHEGSEVLFDHIHNITEAEKLQGFWKLQKCSEEAREDGLDWVWIDTCCIDKTSSSELSEAINSMFSWYRKSEVCYAYLDDVALDTAWNPWRGHVFKDSEWFRRGWTLQELVAPKHVIFFAKDWSEIGTRKSLVDRISWITFIDRDVLLGCPMQVSIAQRMLWASNRKTTRVEDMAYCLMGLFGVHMPTIYGEGKQAFIRLQHEIMRSTTDHSIFPWNSWNVDGKVQDILAPEPSRFGHKAIGSSTMPRIVRPMPYDDFARLFRTEYSPEYTVTNHGIRIRLPTKQNSLPNGECEYIAALTCRISDHDHLVGLRLRPIKGTTDQCCRVGLVNIDNLDLESFVMKNLYLAHHSHSATLDVLPDMSITLLPVDAPRHYTPRQVYPRRRWDIRTLDKLSMIANGRTGPCCAVAVLQQENEHRNERIGLVFRVDYGKDDKPCRIRASLLIDDDGTGTWWTIPPKPVVLCTSSSDREAANLIWRKCQNEQFHDWDLSINLETCSRRFHQISLERGSRVVHWTIDTFVRTRTNERILEVRIVNHANPNLTGWSLIWFLGSILRHIPTSDLKSRVLKNISSTSAHDHMTIFFARMFLYGEEAWKVRDVPEATDFMARPAEELWRTYFDKVRVHTIHSDNVDIGDGDIPAYRYGKVKVLEGDFLGVAAHFKATITSVPWVTAPRPIASNLDDYLRLCSARRRLYVLPPVPDASFLVDENPIETI